MQNVNNPKNAKQVEFSNTATGSLDIAGTIDTYSFAGTKGDEVVVRITKTSGNLWPRITLFGPSGKEIKRAYDSSTTELTYTLTGPVDLTVLVDNGISAAYTGDYSLFAGITSGSQGTTEGNPVVPALTTTGASAIKPSGTPDSAKTTTPGSDIPTNYLLYIIIALVVIVILVIAYSKRVKKPKTADTAASGIQIPTSYHAPVGKGAHHDVFISYANRDKPVADAICNHLESRRIRCWIAPRDIVPGMQYQESIIDAIDTSSIMVLVFSVDSNESPHVLTEVNEAMSNKVIIIPFRVEDVQPSKSMKYLISTSPLARCNQSSDE